MNAEPRIPILVAEDSEDNRFLLHAYCRGTEYDLTFAENGRKAVDAYQYGSFHMVIMDIQMPVMDGLAATRLIRDLESNRGRQRTPILALTANVMPADVLQAREAGCDVHLPKPISKETFLSALESWKPNRPEHTSAVRIEMQPGLEPLAMRYLFARQNELPLLRDLSQTVAFDELKRMAHNLKGSGTSYGFPDLTSLGASLEKAAIARDSAQVFTQVEALADYLAAAIEELRRLGSDQQNSEDGKL